MEKETQRRCPNCGKECAGTFCSLACRAEDVAPPRVADASARVNHERKEGETEAEGRQPSISSAQNGANSVFQMRLSHSLC